MFSLINPQNAITHTINSDKVSITGTWTAPPLGTGPIRFRYYEVMCLKIINTNESLIILCLIFRFAVVQTVLTYWADIMSDVIYESGIHKDNIYNYS